MVKSKKQLDELEDLAKKFIVGYQPPNRYERILIEIREKIDSELDYQAGDRAKLLRLRDEIVKRHINLEQGRISKQGSTISSKGKNRTVSNDKR